MRYVPMPERSVWRTILRVYGSVAARIVRRDDRARLDSGIEAALGADPDLAARRSFMTGFTGIGALFGFASVIPSVAVMIAVHPLGVPAPLVMIPCFLLISIAFVWGLRAGLNEIDAKRRQSPGDVTSREPAGWTQPSTIDLLVAIVLVAGAVWVTSG